MIRVMVNLSDLVARFGAFIRAGYPHGVPQTDYIPLLALLRRRLSDDEVVAVAADLAARGELSFDNVDIGVVISRLRHRSPCLSMTDVARPDSPPSIRQQIVRPCRSTSRG